MLLHRDIMPQFRDADECGLIGARGYLNYMQDSVTEYMHNIGKGNDTLPEEYGIVWMFTKYRMHVIKETDFTDRIQMDTWVEPGKMKAIVYQGFSISRNEELFGQGRAEMCLYDLNRQRLTRLDAIDLPKDLGEDKDFPTEEFSRFSMDLACMTRAYTHTVAYTDLDKSGHMNNLRYVELFLNAFPGTFYRQKYVSDLEIHFIDQCYEGETLRVLSAETARDQYDLAAVKADGTLAAQGSIQVKIRENFIDYRNEMR